ncbi:hypothetical protein O0L34_g3028 [Tuta absoluta]|nr:hypothetical protein O0L34_g3028 [Tuta absoluta]
MGENGYGPVTGHMGRIPNFGKTQVNPTGNYEPPACIQNAMMTKDKKPFTYTPGGLDLSQIRTPSMARRMARQRSLEEQEQAYGHQAVGPTYHPQGGPASYGPPPPPLPTQSKVPAPPPPPPLLIEAQSNTCPKIQAMGERPEIVIPENPIGMLRKTNSPYHWETEQAELNRIGAIPKFQEKVPSPLTVKMPPSTFSQQPPQSYTPQGQNFQRPNYSYGNQNQPESPIYRPEAQYANQSPSSPNTNGSPITRELLQRQDSQFNKSPQPFAGQSPLGNGSSYSTTQNNNRRQPERRDAPASNMNSPQSPQINRNQFSPNVQQYSPNHQNQSSPANSAPVYHTLPKTAPKDQNNYVNNNQNNNVMYNNTREAAATQNPKTDSNDPYPWRTQSMNRSREPENLQSIYHNSQPINQNTKYTPPWVNNNVTNNQSENNIIPQWKQEIQNIEKPHQHQQQFSPSWTQQDANNNHTQDKYNPPWKVQQNEPSQPSPPVRHNQTQEQPYYQSTMSIPVTPRKQNTQPEQTPKEPQKEIVYVNQEPVYFCPETAMPAWVKSQKEKTKTPPPVWVQKPLERKSAPRELYTPPRDTNHEPEWVKKSNEMQRGAREVVSPPKYQQPAQPSWSTRPSDNRKSLPRDGELSSPGSRVIPIQIDTDSRQGNQPPPLRIVINMQQPGPGPNTQAPYSQPTQRIMRVLSPQLVRLDDGPSQSELPSLNRSFQNSQEQQGPRERIIPIQIEGAGSNGANKNFGGRY